MYIFQACDISGGIYLKIPQRAGLLQYLLVSGLSDSVSVVAWI